MVAASTDFSIKEQSADDRAICVCAFEIMAKGYVLCALRLLDSQSQLQVRFGCPGCLGYRMQLLCSRKPSPRLRQNEELDVVCPPRM